MDTYKSVHKRFAIYVSLGSLLFTLIIGIASFVVEYQSEHARSSQMLDGLVAAVRVSASVAAFAHNTPIAEDVLNGLLANQIIAGGRISSDIEIDGKKFIQQKSQYALNKDKDKDTNKDTVIEYPLFSPVNETDMIGTLAIYSDVKEINQRAFNAALRYAGLLILQVPVTAVLIMLLFGRMIGTPLANVAQAIRAVLPGSPTRIAMPPKQETNEIGMLVNSTNSLLAAAEHAIVEERRLQAEKDELEGHFQRIFATTSIGVMVLKANGELVSCNPVLLSRIAGISSDALTTSKHENFLGILFSRPEHAQSMVDEAALTGRIVAGDLQIKGPLHERWVHCMFSTTLDANGKIEFIEGVLYDVTVRRAQESEARRAAELDLLTGISNRRGMEIFLERALRLAFEKSATVGLLMLDLDGFKSVNDTYGHAAGDIVLKEVANRMLSRIRRASDLVARQGGDEFVVIAADFGSATDLLEQIAQDLIMLIGQPIQIAPHTWVNIGASIGIAHAPYNGDTRDAIIKAADAAMYAVKFKGKNNYAFAENTAQEGRSLPE